jgi:hypothetical protein
VLDQTILILMEKENKTKIIVHCCGDLVVHIEIRM